MLIDARKHPWYLELTPAEMEAVIAAVPALLAVVKAMDEEIAPEFRHLHATQSREALAALDVAAPDWREWSA